MQDPQRVGEIDAPRSKWNVADVGLHEQGGRPDVPGSKLDALSEVERDDPAPS